MDSSAKLDSLLQNPDLYLKTVTAAIRASAGFVLALECGHVATWSSWPPAQVGCMECMRQAVNARAGEEP